MSSTQVNADQRAEEPGERPEPAGPEPGGARALLRSAVHGVGVQNVSLLIALVALVAIFGSQRSDVFFTPANVVNIANATALLCIVAMGQTLVILSGGLDLSVGSTVGLASVCIASVMQTGGAAAGIATAVAVGAVAGLGNGLIITAGRVNPVIATLGTLSAYQGVAFLISRGESITVLNGTFTLIGAGRWRGVPVAVLITAAVVLVCFAVLRWTDVGRNVYAMGGNPVAARLAGIGVARYTVVLYVTSGMIAGIAAVLLTARTGSGQPASGSAGLELSSITAAVLGGCALSGGRGTVVGTVLGVLILGVLDNGLTLLNVETFWQLVAKGLLLVFAVVLQQWRAERPWREWAVLRSVRARPAAG